ncbi:MAG TPA: hypothetical protein VK689_03020, partial [Armatimonadota bacterium]|nr:hypothetical protein [Armatimonadota bacterium]
MNYFSTLIPALAILCTLLSSLPARAQTTPPVQEGTLAYRDARLPKKPPPRGWRVYSAREVNPRYDYGPTRDPRYNQAYPLCLQVACSSKGDDARSGRRFVIHYLKPEDEPLARRVGAVMAHLYWIGVDYLGKGWSGSRYANVWLARNGTAGGEEFEGHLYLFAILEHRAPAEWVRELAHEYSHTHLPRVGEFTQPEKWANGYLGERLFLKWMLSDNGFTDVWGERIDGAAYVANGVAP